MPTASGWITAGAGSADTTLYTPAVPANWSPQPTTVAGALDQEAARITALESVPTLLPNIYTCGAGDLAPDLVYQTPVALTVAKADASDPTKMRAIGFIAAKLSATSCAVQSLGPLAGFGALPLVPGTEYFADPASPGGISTVGGDPTIGEVSQPVGIAKTNDILMISIATSPVAGG